MAGWPVQRLPNGGPDPSWPRPCCSRLAHSAGQALSYTLCIKTHPDLVASVHNQVLVAVAVVLVLLLAAQRLAVGRRLGGGQLVVQGKWAARREAAGAGALVLPRRPCALLLGVVGGVRCEVRSCDAAERRSRRRHRGSLAPGAPRHPGKVSARPALLWCPVLSPCALALGTGPAPACLPEVQPASAPARHLDHLPHAGGQRVELRALQRRALEAHLPPRCGRAGVQATGTEGDNCVHGRQQAGRQKRRAARGDAVEPGVPAHSCRAWRSAWLLCRAEPWVGARHGTAQVQGTTQAHGTAQARAKAVLLTDRAAAPRTGASRAREGTGRALQPPRYAACGV
jgi:hypothetical protein